MKFALCEVHKGAPLTWFLVLVPGDGSIDAAINLIGGSVQCLMRNPHAWSGETASLCTAITIRSLGEMPLLLPQRIGWFVNPNGGMCPNPYRIIGTCDADTFPRIPGATIDDLVRTARITQWPNGTHYYSRLADGRDVSVDGLSKWETMDKAISATRRFIEETWSQSQCEEKSARKT